MSRDRTGAAVKVHKIINSVRTPKQAQVARTMLDNFTRMHGCNDCLERYMLDVEQEQQLNSEILRHESLPAVSAASCDWMHLQTEIVA